MAPPCALYVYVRRPACCSKPSIPSSSVLASSKPSLLLPLILLALHLLLLPDELRPLGAGATHVPAVLCLLLRKGVEVVGRVLVHLEAVLAHAALRALVARRQLVERRAPLVVDVPAVDADHGLRLRTVRRGIGPAAKDAVEEALRLDLAILMAEGRSHAHGEASRDLRMRARPEGHRAGRGHHPRPCGRRRGQLATKSHAAENDRRCRSEQDGHQGCRCRSCHFDSHRF
mmetsp:Transcript_19597/g.36896  ORF Transcript_19597/g.36896 Transcript_19597/m.36896 type:complete len:230 (-) Transcript_19597:39-728(-)